MSRPPEAARVVGAYRELISGRLTGREVFRNLRAFGGYGVVRGLLRVLADRANVVSVRSRFLLRLAFTLSLD